MSIADSLPPTSSVAAGHYLLNIGPLLAVIAAGLLIGFVYCLVNVRVSKPSVFGLLALQCSCSDTSPHTCIRSKWTALLGLSYDT